MINAKGSVMFVTRSKWINNINSVDLFLFGEDPSICSLQVIHHVTSLQVIHHITSANAMHDKPSVLLGGPLPTYDTRDRTELTHPTVHLSTILTVPTEFCQPLVSQKNTFMQVLIRLEVDILQIIHVKSRSTLATRSCN